MTEPSARSRARSTMGRARSTMGRTGDTLESIQARVARRQERAVRLGYGTVANMEAAQSKHRQETKTINDFHKRFGHFGGDDVTDTKRHRLMVLSLKTGVDQFKPESATTGRAAGPPERATPEPKS